MTRTNVLPTAFDSILPSLLLVLLIEHLFRKLIIAFKIIFFLAVKAVKAVIMTAVSSGNFMCTLQNNFHTIAFKIKINNVM